MAVTHGATTLDVATNAVVDQLDGAGSKLVFRIAGACTPASPTTAAATLTFATPAFGASSSGTATRTASIASDTFATGSGTAVAYATLQTSADVIVIQCEVAASGKEIDMTGGLTIGAGDTVSCSSLTYKALVG